MRTRSENQVEIFLIRHGLTKENEEHRYLGSTNASLSDKGIVKLKEKIAGNLYPDKGKINYLFTGPMNRCKETASLIYPDCSQIEISELTEMDFGDFECKNYVELNGNEDYQRWIDSGGTIAFPNGESREDFIERSKLGFLKVIDYLRNEKEDDLTSLVVLHGGNIMAILYSFCQGEYFDYQVKPAEGYRCEIELWPEIKFKKIEELK